MSVLIGVLGSDNWARTWVRINDDQHQFGLIGQITGDPKLYGRVYVGTFGRGRRPGAEERMSRRRQVPREPAVDYLI